MFLMRTRGKIRRVRTGLALIAEVYRKQPHPLRLARAVWVVSTRRGLVGLRQWLINASLIEDAGQPIHLSNPLGAPTAFPPAAAVLYQDWLVRFDPLADEGLNAARLHLGMLDLPELLILAVIRDSDISSLGQMAASWQDSIHPAWKAAIVIPPDLNPVKWQQLRSTAAQDSRISIVTTPGEVEILREGVKFVLLTYGGTVLNRLSVYMFLESASRNEAAAVYSDHDYILHDCVRENPRFKPQFSPEYLARHNYIGQCLLISNSIAWTVSDSAQLFGLDLPGFDRLVARLLLQSSPRNGIIDHLPFIMFHVLGQEFHLSHNMPLFSTTGPTVSIIIPTRDGLGYLKPCINSIIEKTTYDRTQFEIVIIDNGSVEPETLQYLDGLAAKSNVIVIRHPAPFNFSEINNIGVEASQGQILVFLNDDTLVQDPAWLGKLVGYAQQPGVGIVGAKLLFPDGTIQHGGCVAGGSMGTVEHLHSFSRPEAIAATDHTREMTLLTGACIAVRREIFQKIGGFDPILRVTWNDSKLCLAALTAGLRNIYIADPLIIHDESKTRGNDNTLSSYIRYFGEADYTRRRYRGYFYDDPSYNPNLSLERVGALAEPPRVRRPWLWQTDKSRRILLLSSVFKIGYGVPVVIKQHALKFVENGYEVILGGPKAENEMSFPGCTRVILNSAKEAANYAFINDVSLIVAHTPPFFEVPITIGGHIPVLSYDYGEPSADFFKGATRDYLLNVAYQKRGAASLTTTVAAISQSVKDETLNKDALVLGLANSHLPHWKESLRKARDDIRQTQGWQNKFIVLTVCRFHENERMYKGLDKIADILREFPYFYPDQSRELVWVLAGAGTPTDVMQAEELGFRVFPNVADVMLTELYQAADAYMGFSKWEGYNLGISQALAMGLPVLGSDIPAHREFGIFTTNSVLIGCVWLAKEVELRTASLPEQRLAKVYDWESKTAAFVDVIQDMLHHADKQMTRHGSSGRVWQDFPMTRNKTQTYETINLEHGFDKVQLARTNR